MSGRRRWRLRPSTLRGRLALRAATAVLVAITLAGSAAFGVTAKLLQDQIDEDIRNLAVAFTAAPGGTAGQSSPWPQGAAQPCSQVAQAPQTPPYLFTVIAKDGTVCHPSVGDQITVTPSDRTVADGSTGGGFRDGQSHGGLQLRVLVRHMPGGGAIVVGRDTSGVAEVLRHLRGILLLLSIVGALGALAAGLLVARAGLRPVDRLADVAERIARTQNLAITIPSPTGAGDKDEVTRLAQAFNRMVSALAAARARQAQLVADAGHELRTPLTSLRTNIDLLLRSQRSGRPLPAGDRDDLLDSLHAQVSELTDLVGELVVLAHDEPESPRETVRWDRIAGNAVQRVTHRAGDRRLSTDLQPWETTGDAAALERAVVNVLDNATKFSPPGSTIQIRLRDGVLHITDQGPGIPPEHRTQAFERFWRANEARALPGSGLGLAIVADTMRNHDGTATITGGPPGGTRVSLALPGQPPTDRRAAPKGLPR